MTNKQEILKLYEKLPKKSRGRKADNPKMFTIFYDNNGALNPEAWPLIASL